VALGLVAEIPIATGHPKSMIDGLQAEQVLRADIDTITTGGAAVLVHHRQAEAIQGNGAKIAHVGAVAHAETAPGAALAATRHQGRAPA